MVSAFVGFFVLPSSTAMREKENKTRTTPMTQRTSTVGPTESNSFFSVVYKNLLFSRPFQLLCLLHFSVYCSRSGVSEWVTLYLMEHRSFDRLEASACVSLFEVGGFGGSLLSGFISDLVFKGKRKPLIGLSLITFVVSVVIFFNTSFLKIGCLLMGASIFAPSSLMGLMVSETVPPRISVTGVGIASAFSAAGGSVAGYPVSLVINHFGWDALYFVVLTFSVSSVVLQYMLASQKKSGAKKLI